MILEFLLSKQEREPVEIHNWIFQAAREKREEIKNEIIKAEVVEKFLEWNLEIIWELRREKLANKINNQLICARSTNFWILIRFRKRWA